MTHMERAKRTAARVACLLDNRGVPCHVDGFRVVIDNPYRALRMLYDGIVPVEQIKDYDCAPQRDDDGELVVGV